MAPHRMDCGVAGPRRDRRLRASRRSSTPTFPGAGGVGGSPRHVPRPVLPCLPQRTAARAGHGAGVLRGSHSGGRGCGRRGLGEGGPQAARPGDAARGPAATRRGDLRRFRHLAGNRAGPRGGGQARSGPTCRSAADQCRVHQRDPRSAGSRSRRGVAALSGRRRGRAGFCDQRRTSCRSRRRCSSATSWRPTGSVVWPWATRRSGPDSRRPRTAPPAWCPRTTA